MLIWRSVSSRSMGSICSRRFFPGGCFFLFFPCGVVGGCVDGVGRGEGVCEEACACD